MDKEKVGQKLCQPFCYDLGKEPSRSHINLLLLTVIDYTILYDMFDDNPNLYVMLFVLCYLQSLYMNFPLASRFWVTGHSIEENTPLIQSLFA